MTWSDLGTAKYLQLTSYRKDGTPVGTPVWAAPDGDRIVVWTNPNSWKVKRIRRNPEVTLQICNNNGKKTSGPVLPGRAEILDAAELSRVREVIARKYGIIGRVTMSIQKLVKGDAQSVGIAIEQR